MTEDFTYKLKMQERQHQHEIRMAVLKLFQDDPSAKYWVSIAIGAGSLWVMNLVDGAGQVVSQAGAEPTTEDKYPGLVSVEAFLGMNDKERGEYIGQLTAEERKQWDWKMGRWLSNPLNAAAYSARWSADLAADSLGSVNPFAWLNTLPKMLATGWIGVNTVALILTCVFGQSDKGHHLLGKCIEAAGEAVPF